jgi:hypothetical protein
MFSHRPFNAVPQKRNLFRFPAFAFQQDSNTGVRVGLWHGRAMLGGHFQRASILAVKSVSGNKAM